MLLRLTMLYTGFSIVLAGWLFDNSARAFTVGSIEAFYFGIRFISGGIYVVLPMLLPIFWFGRTHLPSRVRHILPVALALVLLQVGFSLTKDTIPVLSPYYADPMLARFDHWMLGGHDAWSLVHGLLPDKAVSWMPLLYMQGWSLCMVSFPILLVAGDPDDARVRRYLLLFFGSWVVIGNVLALLGSSVGPVYYDRLLGSDRFAGLDGVLRQSGFVEGALGQFQNAQWARFASGSFVPGIALSAFPSMHVAIAAVVSFYIAERWRLLAPLGLLFLGAIYLVSIYSGYHYAIDGLVSLALVGGSNLALKRWGMPARGVASRLPAVPR